MKTQPSTAAILAIILWGSTAICAFVHAQKADPPETKQTISTGEALTDDSLKQTLSNMGYEPKKLSKGYLLAIKQDTWTLNIQLVLSPNMEKLGMNANMGKVDDPATVAASDWLNLLVSNGDIDPSAFYFDKDQKKLYIHRSIDNRSITPAILRKEIENFSSNIRQTADLWKFTK